MPIIFWKKSTALYTEQNIGFLSLSVAALLQLFELSF
jgi:hypothetical protein